MKKLLCGLYSRRALRAYAWTLVSVFTVLFFFRQYVNWSGSKRWVAVQEELVKEGESIDFRKVTPEPVPDDRNFCAIPLLKNLGATPVSTDDKSEAGLNRQRLVAAALPNNDRIGPRPGFGQSVALGRKMDLQAWAEWLRKEGSLPLPPDSGDPAKDMLTALGKHEALIKELAAGLDRPEAQWTPAWKTRNLPENLFAIPLPHYTVIRDLIQLLCFRSIIAARAGDAIKAHESLLMAVRLNQATMQEPFLIGLLVATTNAHFINSAVWEIGDAKLGTSDDFRRLQQALAKMDFRQSALLAWRSELAGSSGALAYLKRRRDVSMFSMVEGSGPFLGDVAGAIFTHVLPDGWFDANAATVVQWNLDYSLKPLRDGGFKEMMVKQDELTSMVKKQKASLPSRFENTMALMIVPATTSISSNIVYSQCMLNQAVAACALERYRLDHGKYPDTLAEAFGEDKEVPKDVLFGKAMGYRKTNEGRYALWSVGFDNKDDGGKRVLDAKKPESTKFRDVNYAGDWVWDYPAL